MASRRGRPASQSLLHGTVASYQHRTNPCRCQLCAEAWRVYKRAYRARRRTELLLKARQFEAEQRWAHAELIRVEMRKRVS